MSSTRAVSVRAAVRIERTRCRHQPPIPEPETHYRLRLCGRQRYMGCRKSQEQHSAQFEKSTFRVNASSEKMFKREYSFVTQGSAICANVSTRIQMLRQCYEGRPSAINQLSCFYSARYGEHRDQPALCYTPRRPASQFERFLFPQCFPQEAARSPDLYSLAERCIFGC